MIILAREIGLEFFHGDGPLEAPDRDFCCAPITGSCAVVSDRTEDPVHNGQADIEAVYPESFHPAGQEAALHGSVISGLMGSGMTGH
jgi:hypothetical protein